MKKSTIFLTIAAAILVVLIGKAFIFNDAVKFYLLIFVAVGLGLALLRLGVNGAIKKMRSKHIGFKILFFKIDSVRMLFSQWMAHLSFLV